MNIINNTLYLKSKLHEFINKKIDSVNIYKTLNSIVYQKNDLLYCFNNDYNKTINKEKIILDGGYKLETIWESEFIKNKKDRNERKY